MGATWQSPGQTGNLRGLPHQCAHWFAMTLFFYSASLETEICPSLDCSTTR